MSKIGFCFSGEGARGSVQAGITQSLSQKGINADLTIGSSSGAICAAGYSYLNPAGLSNLWAGITSLWNVFGLNYRFLWNTGILNQKPSEKYISAALKNTPICEAVVSRLNSVTGEVEYVSNKEATTADFAEAVLCAYAIPGLVTPRNGYIDAAFMVESPLEKAIDLGCTEIHVILGSPLSPAPFILPKGFMAFAYMFLRGLELSLTQLTILDVLYCLRSAEIPIHVYQPNTCFCSMLDFSKCPAGVEYGLAGNYIDLTCPMNRVMLPI